MGAKRVVIGVITSGNHPWLLDRGYLPFSFIALPLNLAVSPTLQVITPVFHA